MNEFTNIGVGGMLGRFVPIVLKFKNQRPIIKEEFDKEQICC
jgi:hypothetical protein